MRKPTPIKIVMTVFIKCTSLLQNPSKWQTLHSCLLPRVFCKGGVMGGEATNGLFQKKKKENIGKEQKQNSNEPQKGRRFVGKRSWKGNLTYIVKAG